MRSSSVARGVALLAFAVLAACTPGRSVSLQVSRCDAVLDGGALKVAAHVTNRGDRPMTSADLALDFYANYRFTRVTGGVTFAPVLDPGASRDVTFATDAPKSGASGGAMRCVATRAVYGDGSVESVDP